MQSSLALQKASNQCTRTCIDTTRAALERAFTRFRTFWHVECDCRSLMNTDSSRSATEKFHSTSEFSMRIAERKRNDIKRNSQWSAKRSSRLFFVLLLCTREGLRNFNYSILHCCNLQQTESSQGDNIPAEIENLYSSCPGNSWNFSPFDDCKHTSRILSNTKGKLCLRCVEWESACKCFMKRYFLCEWIMTARTTVWSLTSLTTKCFIDCIIGIYERRLDTRSYIEQDCKEKFNGRVTIF